MDEVPVKDFFLGRFIPARYILAILGSIGMSIIYGLKVNLSVTMVGMLNHTAIAAASDYRHQTLLDLNVTQVEECQGSNASSYSEDGPFIWSEPLQGRILSCYFWGYFVSQIPGGRLAELYSAKWVMFFSVLINVVCTLLTPVMAEFNSAAIIFMRILEGVGGGVTFPAMHVLLSKWAPPAERSVMAALVYAGTSLGTVLSMLMAGGLTSSLGWESVFYMMGGMSCVWLVLWVALIQDTPQTQPYISVEERKMILESLGHKNLRTQKLPLPWKAVCTSPPFLAILVAHTCSNWGWYMLLVELPFYMKQILKFNITENATATALPFFTLWIFSLLLSRTLDSLRARGTVTTTTARKIGTLFASVVPMLCLLSLCYVGCMRTLATVLMAVGVTCIGGMFSGFLVNHIDIAPNFAGILVAVTNTLATVPGIIVPIFVGHITEGNRTINAWRVIFYVTSALYTIEIIVYSLFGSGEEQAWNKNPEDKNGANSEVQPLKNQNKTDVEMEKY